MKKAYFHFSVDNQNVADVLSSIAANTVVSAEEKNLSKYRSPLAFSTPLQMLQDAPFTVPMEAPKAPSFDDIQRSTKTINSEKFYLNCLERNPMVHGYTNLIATLYDLYEKQAIAARKLSPSEAPLSNDDQYQSFLEQVRSKEKEMMYGGARMFV